MPHFRITLAYDGTDFVGWQRQASGASIQELLETALRELDGRDVTVTGAGRTDAGVHALGQVASFTLNRTATADVVVRALNARLPASVRVLAAEETAAGFNARFAARTKTYRYRIYNSEVASPFERRYAWHVAAALDVDAMDNAARILEGRHDFAAFRATGSDTQSTEREVFTSKLSTTGDTEDTGEQSFRTRESNLCVRSVLRGGALAGGELIVYEITGDGFLRHMVRAIVGTLVEIGRGRRPTGWMTVVLASRDRGLAGPTAPAEGLFLVRVGY